jgi:5'-nucleotidase
VARSVSGGVGEPWQRASLGVSGGGPPVWYLRVRILVTNDDGVHAPGLAALVRALRAWAHDDADRELVVVAPLANHSGASAAVGTVFEREAIGFRRVHIDGADDVAAYGLDAPPALTVIVGGLGAFGPPPDVVVSGINLGVNVGRSVLHSGTVGAALTAAQHGYRALAVSMRSVPEHHFETAAALAVGTLPAIAQAAPGIVLSLNVPSVDLDRVRGVVPARISNAGLVRAARAELASGDAGTVELTLGTAIPSLGATAGEHPSDDAGLIGAGFATVTALHGVGEDHREAARTAVEHATAGAITLLG